MFDNHTLKNNVTHPGLQNTRPFFSAMLSVNQWPKYFVNQQYTTLTFANFRRPIHRSRVIYKPFQKVVEEISIVRFTPLGITYIVFSLILLDLYDAYFEQRARSPSHSFILGNPAWSYGESLAHKWPIDQCWYDL